MLNEKDTRNKILKAALKLFAESSYTMVTIDDIARKAGVSKGAVFHYFDSKITLAKEAVKVAMETLWIGKMEDQIEKCKTPEEKLSILIDNTLSPIIEQSKFMRFMNELFVYLGEKNGTVEMMRELWKYYVTAIETVLAEANVSNSKVKSRLLCACMDGFIYQILIIQDFGVDLDSLKKELYNLFLGDKK